MNNERINIKMEGAKEKMRSKRGITLVSLVVTIIVLIILAGVSINLTVGENGIITMAKKARENMELATIEEQTKLNALYTQIRLEDENIGGIDNSSISKLIEFKQKVASAITDMGIETLETANADTMASNIRSISTNKDAASISYDNTNSELTSTNVQGAVDEIDEKMAEVNNNFGIIFPDYTKKELIPINSKETSITVDQNCLLLIGTRNTTDTSDAIYVLVDETYVYSNSTNYYQYNIIPVRAGSTIRFSFHASHSNFIEGWYLLKE